MEIAEILLPDQPRSPEDTLGALCIEAAMGSPEAIERLGDIAVQTMVDEADRAELVRASNREN